MNTASFDPEGEGSRPR